MLYAVNICTIPKQNEYYDVVAVNKFPIFIQCSGDDEFYKMLNNAEISTFIENQLKTDFLFDNAKIYVRSIDEETGDHKEFDFSVKEFFNK